MEAATLAARGYRTPDCAFDDPCHRIPALAVTASGRLVAAWDVRADWRDLPGEFDIVCAHSDDDGRTWSEPRLLHAHEPGHGFGDASLIALPTGPLLCCHVGSTGRSFFSAQAGAGAPGLELWVSTSHDDGATWTHRDITAELKPASASGMFFASGNGLVLGHGEHPGRLVQPVVLRIGEEHFAAMALSDDSGHTWRLGDLVGPDCDENKVVELADGTVLMHARAVPRRRQAVSTDGGVSFGNPLPHGDLVDPACNGGLVRVGESLVATLLDDPAERRRLCARTSTDDGRTWSAPILVDPGAAAYSVACALPDGSVVVAYERGNYDSVDVVRLTPAELGLDGSTPTLVPREGSGDAALPPEVAPAPAS